MKITDQHASLICTVQNALDEHALSLSKKHHAFLQQSRAKALRSRKSTFTKQPRHFFAFAYHHGTIDNKLPRLLHKTWRFLPIFSLLMGFFGIIQWANIQHKHEVTSLDTAIIDNQLPLNAYIDSGFRAYLQDHRQ